MTGTKGMCAYIPVVQDLDRQGGYAPSFVFAGQPDYTPISGCIAGTRFLLNWGNSLQAARDSCDEFNRGSLQICPAEAIEIVATTVAARRSRNAVKGIVYCAYERPDLWSLPSAEYSLSLAHHGYLIATLKMSRSYVAKVVLAHVLPPFDAPEIRFLDILRAEHAEAVCRTVREWRLQEAEDERILTKVG